VRVSFNWEAKSAGKTKISELDVLALSIDQQILWFQISMENPVLVQMDERLQDLV